MKIIMKVVLTLVVLGQFSCQQKENHKEASVKTESEQQDDFQFPAVSIKEGQLWQANEETTQGIKNMQHLIENYSTENGNPEELMAELKSEFAMIFKNCTMTGDAHEQLHNYLIPLRTRIDNLSKGFTMENTNDLKNYLRDYFNYFE